MDRACGFAANAFVIAKSGATEQSIYEQRFVDCFASL
jgi:hypothetical protein